MKIGIFGGSFNPIHYGHVRLARQLLALAGLDEVWFVVSPQNPLKQQSELLDDQVRLEMVQAALRREKNMKASDVEFRLPKPSYTWNTLEMLKQEHPSDEFTLLIGGDNWERFHLWYRAEDIRKQYHIVVYPRGSSPEDASLDISPVSSEEGRIDYLVGLPLINISSTMVRQRIHEGRPINRLVPKAVADIIRERGLYL